MIGTNGDSRGRNIGRGGTGVKLGLRPTPHILRLRPSCTSHGATSAPGSHTHLGYGVWVWNFEILWHVDRV